MVRGDKRYVDELVRLLKVFSKASRMEINWEKERVLIGLISIRINMNESYATIGNGHRKGTYPNYLVPPLVLTLVYGTLINF